jgi:hypothetical protein
MKLDVPKNPLPPATTRRFAAMMFRKYQLGEDIKRDRDNRRKSATECWQLVGNSIVGRGLKK